MERIQEIQAKLKALRVPEIPAKFTETESKKTETPALEKRLAKLRKQLSQEAEILLKDPALSEEPERKIVSPLPPAFVEKKTEAKTFRLLSLCFVLLVCLLSAYFIWQKKGESENPIPQSPTTITSEEKEQQLPLKPPTRPNRTHN